MVKHGLGTTLTWGRASLCALTVCLPLTSLSFLSETAAASCGDYVIFRPRADVAPLSAKLPSTEIGKSVVPAKAPCNTPLCRGSKPADPVPTPPPPQQIDQRPLALLAGAAAVECPFLAGSGWRRLDETPLDGFSQSLLRPPCA